PVARCCFLSAVLPFACPLGVRGFSSTGRPDLVVASGSTPFPVFGSVSLGCDVQPGFAFTLAAKSLWAARPAAAAAFSPGGVGFNLGPSSPAGAVGWPAPELTPLLVSAVVEPEPGGDGGALPLSSDWTQFWIVFLTSVYAPRMAAPKSRLSSGKA